MNAIEEILAAFGYDSAAEMDVETHLKIEVEGYMPLSIEKIGEDRLSVAHYYTQRGDLMSDPEIVFDLADGVWRPVRYTQHPHVHQYDEDGIPGVGDFAEQWSRNLRTQGFVDAAQEQADA